MKKAIVLTVFSLLIACLFTACAKGKAKTSGSSFSSEEDDDDDSGDDDFSSDSAPDDTYFYVHATSSNAIDIYTHNRAGATWSEKCQVDLDATSAADRDIECIVEMKELDLYHQGLTLNFSTPSSLRCAYLSFYPYFIFQYKVGKGPTSVTKTIAADGSISYVSAGGDAGGSVTNVSGSAACGFDYGTLNADGTYPNCCLGRYSMTTVDNTTAPATTTTETGVEWGGDVSSCLGGTGKDHLPDATTKFPRPVLYRMIGNTAVATNALSSQPSDAGYQKVVKALGGNVHEKIISDLSPFVNGSKYEIAPLIAVPFSTNLNAANYISDGATPPEAFSAPTSYPEYVPNANYLWGCYDEAGEQYARIRLQIRDWNLDEEFAEQENGDPDSSGAETDWPSEDKNDYMDWDDIIDAALDFPERLF